MTPRGTPRLVTAGVAVLTLAVLSACSADAEDPAEEPTPAATPSRAPEPPAAPELGSCYRLGFKEALAPTNGAAARRCAQPHTSETFDVGTVDTVVDGHLLAIDSAAVQDQVAAACPSELAAFVGGDQDALRLSMIRPVWFTPTVEESDTGADWYRCDAVVLAGDSSLMRTSDSLSGILDRPADAEAVAMCGTAAPDAEDFTRVPCSAEHSWRALEIVDFAVGDYPGTEPAQENGQAQCEDAAGAQAEDPLDFAWGYEWPTAEQWEAGMTFGRCWAPV